MSWTRFVSGASPYVGVVISPLTSVAKAIYELQAIQDLRQGLGQLFRVPRFLNHAKQTRGLLEQSALSNIVKYALPIMMYRRAIDLSLKVFPDSIDPVINALDWCITITIFARLYLLKATDNTVYLFSLPRVIANDVTRQLPIDLSRLLSQELARILKGSILRNGQSETDLRVELSADLLPVFVKFISKNEFSALSFASLQQELNDVFIRLINRQDDLAILPDFIDKFSALLAKSMADTLAMPFQLTKNETHAQTQRDFCKLLKTIFRTEESERITAFLFDKLDQVTREVQSSFPIKHHGPCGCGHNQLHHHRT